MRFLWISRSNRVKITKFIYLYFTCPLIKSARHGRRLQAMDDLFQTTVALETSVIVPDLQTIHHLMSNSLDDHHICLT